MPLDPALEQLLHKAELSKHPALYEIPPVEARLAYQNICRAVDSEQKISVHAVENRRLPTLSGGLPIRLYWPYEIEEQTHLPVLVYLHGGGWTIGDLDTHDTACRWLCRESNCVVMAVDYRLAPEHKFSAAVEDVMAAVQWVQHNAASLGGNSQQIIIGGDSAGGNLAAVATQLLRNLPGPQPILQILIYPSLDFVGDYSSHHTYRDNYLVTWKDIEYFRDHYLRSPADAHDYRASPLLNTDLQGLPPALIITAAYDPLCDEGAVYAKRLAEAGVTVDYQCHTDMIHGFITMPGITDNAWRGLAQCAAAIRKYSQ